MSEAAVLREAAAGLRSVSRRVHGEGHHPLSHALRLARSDGTWKGGYAEAIRGALAHQEVILRDVAENLRDAAGWLERLAAEREAAAPGTLWPPGAFPPGAP